MYNQQKTHFLDNGEGECPRTFFTTQLINEIATWIQDGEHIVLGIDANEKINNSKMDLELKAIGLIDILKLSHGTHGPPTYANGSEVIDTLFVSQTFCNIVHADFCQYCLITGQY